MPACGALWPAPECGWAGYCAANASCVCDAGWQVNLPEVDGVVLCTQRAGGAGVTALYMMWAVGLSVNTALQCTIWWIKHRLGRLIDFPDWAEQSGLLCALALWLAVALRGAQQEEWQVLRSRESLLMFLAGLTCIDIPGALVERKKVKFTLKQIGNQMDSEGGASMLKCFSVFNLSAPTFVLIADLGSIYAVELPLPDCLRVHMCYEVAASCLRLVFSRRMMVPLKRKFDELYEFANSNAGTDPEKLLTLRQAKAELDARIKLLPVFVGLRLVSALLTAWPFMISMMTFVLPGLCAFSTVPHMFAMAHEVRVGLPSTKEKRVLVADKISRTASTNSPASASSKTGPSSKVGPVRKLKSGGSLAGKSPSWQGKSSTVAPSQNQEPCNVVVA